MSLPIKLTLIALAVAVAGCVSSAPDLPPERGSVAAATQFTAQDRKMSVRQIDAEIADLTGKIEALQNQVRSRNAGNSLAFYGGLAGASGMSVTPQCSVTSSAEEIKLLKQYSTRRDELFVLKKWKVKGGN